jgi:hypothetical protein
MAQLKGIVQMRPEYSVTREFSMDTLVKECTAMRSWEEYAECLHQGYLPTLVPHLGDEPSQIEWNYKVVHLADRLEELGFRVWRGSDPVRAEFQAERARNYRPIDLEMENSG